MKKFNDIWVRAGMRTNFDRVHSRQGLPEARCPDDRMSHPSHMWQPVLRGGHLGNGDRYGGQYHCRGRSFDAT